MITRYNYIHYHDYIISPTEDIIINTLEIVPTC